MDAPKVYHLFENLSRQSNSMEDFKKRVNESARDEMDEIVNMVLKNNKLWAEYIGIGKKPKEEDLSSRDVEFKAFFQDHSFPGGLDEQRRLADLIELLSGINVTRFINMSRVNKALFPRFLCIVPTRDTCGHSYKIGNPIININSNNTFYSSQARTGGNMITDPEEYRMSTKDEIEDLLIHLLRKSSAYIEAIVFNIGIIKL